MLLPLIVRMFAFRQVYDYYCSSISEKHGISKHFLAWFNRIDEDAGKRAFGTDTTASGVVKSKLGEQIERAKAIDETKGYSKTTRSV